MKNRWKRYFDTYPPLPVKQEPIFNPRQKIRSPDIAEQLKSYLEKQIKNRLCLIMHPKLDSSQKNIQHLHKPMHKHQN